MENYRQLLQMSWYPTSFDRPQTAFTFDLLDTYHKLTLQGKLNLYDFYSAIMQKADNCGQKKVIVSFAVTSDASSNQCAPFSTDITRSQDVFVSGVV